MILDLKYYGDPILRKKCAPIEKITDEMRQLAQDLIESVVAHNGAGLAASQVGRSVQMFVICYANEEDKEGMPILCPPKVYINPKISSPSKETEDQIEACLSIPKISAEVNRPKKIRVEAMDLDGNSFIEEAEGWRARVIMHENDHLNGVLFIDRLSTSQKKKLNKPLKEISDKFTPLKRQPVDAIDQKTN